VKEVPNMDNANTWSECPPGTLTQIAGRAQQRQLVGLAVKTAAIGLLLFGVTFGGWLGNAWWQQRGFRFNGLTCGEVRELLPAYRAGKLDERRSAMLRGHVARCTNCAEFRPEVLGQTSALAPNEAEDTIAAAIFRERYARMVRLAASQPELASAWRTAPAR
jgi:hypothetical protein